MPGADADDAASSGEPGDAGSVDAGLHVVAACASVGIGAIRAVSIGDLDLVVWRTAAGEIRACEARCPHQWNHLAAVGQVEGDEIVCAVHYWRFDGAGTGTVRLVDGTRVPMRDIATYPCHEVDGRVAVQLD
jgi:phenylpropionate dioxygenase-like ring-hydroxylating dioxygenase large terminal subunit